MGRKPKRERLAESAGTEKLLRSFAGLRAELASMEEASDQENAGGTSGQELAWIRQIGVDEVPALEPGERFDSAHFSQATLRVARGLVGAYLVHRSDEGITAGRIVETEAYVGPRDLGAHSRGGKMTHRTRAMYGPRGHAYVFLIYGSYWCFNVVSGPEPVPQAVLVRALEPVLGLDLMRERLQSKTEARDSSLCQGPGKLCRALGITGGLYGEDLMKSDRLYLVPGGLRPGERMARSPRINIDYAGSWISKPWRYYVPGHPAVSGPSKLRK